jgi:hypothetical protein
MQKAKYLARAVGCSFGESANNNVQVGVTMRIAEGDYEGLEITWIGHFTEKTQPRTLESLDYMGWKGEDVSELDNLDEAACTTILPTVVEIVVEPDHYEGKETLKVKWVNLPGAGRFSFKKPVTGGALKQFAAQLKNQIRGQRAQGGGSRPSNNGQRALPNSSHPNAPGSDDDLPF